MEIRNNHPFNWFIRVDPKTKKAKLVLSEVQPTQPEKPTIEPVVEPIITTLTLWQRIKRWFTRT